MATNTLDSPLQLEIGIDVSKDTLDVFDGHKLWQVPNSPQGIKTLLKELKKISHRQPFRITCEATGRYSDLLAFHCLKAGIPVSIANPRHVRDYAKSGGKLAKTDRLDARIIAAFAAHHNPPTLDTAWSERQKFVQCYTRMCSLIDLAASQKASLHQYPEPTIQSEIRKVISTLERQIAAYEKELDTMIKASPELRHKSEVMLKIKGVGKRTVQAVLALMPELGTLNRQQAGALAGLAPMNCESGKMRG